MTRIEFEAEIPLIEKKGKIIQFPEIWGDTGGDGKTKVELEYLEIFQVYTLWCEEKTHKYPKYLIYKSEYWVSGQDPRQTHSC